MMSESLEPVSQYLLYVSPFGLLQVCCRMMRHVVRDASRDLWTIFVSLTECSKVTRLDDWLTYVGGEAVPSETDSDSGKGMMTSYDSVSSLNSTGTNMSNTVAGTGQPPTLENLEQFEVRKQQKDIWENGIEM